MYCNTEVCYAGILRCKYCSPVVQMGITRYRDMHSLNSVKNKILRNELYRKEKMLRMKEKRQLRIQRKKDAKSMGDEVS